ncbi:MAG: DUF1792 domain-containing protein [Synergistaceae bacterium]|nr:DUF1792 domain-containing protein [Synergistaceae bacterium]
MGLIKSIRKLHHFWNTKRFLSNIKFLIKNDFTELPDRIMEDCVFELDELRDYFLSRVPSILSKAESLTLLADKPKSFARFGDGEVDIMQGKDCAFQKYDPLLAEKMLRVLKTRRDDLYVGINSKYFHSVLLGNQTENGRNFHRNRGRFLREFFMREANPEIQYLDATCFLGYFFDDSDAYSEFLPMKRKLFEGRKIAVVTGKSVLEKLDYDIFDQAASKIIIDAPSRNAFSSYDEILRDISGNVSKDTLICLILGQTATVMAADLTDMGYLAWDTGHIAKDYDAYMKKVEISPQAEHSFYAPD